MNRAAPTSRVEHDRHGHASVSLILTEQTEHGAFPASPDFAQYRYCWLRDASFIAYALDRAGEHPAALKYHEWVDRTISAPGVAAQIEAAIDSKLSKADVDPAKMPPARFSLTGGVVDDEWPNFQIDGYGTWLWALNEHLRLSGAETLPAYFRSTVDRTAHYLSALAFEPCFDVWEEHGDEIHTSTLGSVYAGLRAASSMLGNASLSDRADEVREHIQGQARRVGYYAKSNIRRQVDASGLWLATPFSVADLEDPLFHTTAETIERRLTLDGGLRRYAQDTYYGGGAWPVLTCSLGWYYSMIGRPEDAWRCLEWTGAHIDDQGRLAEQFGGESRDPEHYREWVRQWGPPARNLLWSHAMYVILCAEIAASPDSATPNR